LPTVLLAGVFRRETAARHDAGKEQPVEWEAAKRELRKRAE
jgi:hypothetical protein